MLHGSRWWIKGALLSALLALLLFGGLGRGRLGTSWRVAQPPPTSKPAPLSQAPTRPPPTPTPTRPAPTPTPSPSDFNPRQFIQTVLGTVATLVALMVALALLLTVVVRRLWRR